MQPAESAVPELWAVRGQELRAVQARPLQAAQVPVELARAAAARAMAAAEALATLPGTAESAAMTQAQARTAAPTAKATRAQ